MRSTPAATCRCSRVPTAAADCQSFEDANWWVGLRADPPLAYRSDGVGGLSVSTAGVSITPLERYLATLWERGGSDLLITAYSPVLMRVDGQLIPVPGEPILDEADVEAIVLGVLTEDLKTELRTEREVDFSFSYKKVARFRAN